MRLQRYWILLASISRIFIMWRLDDSISTQAGYFITPWNTLLGLARRRAFFSRHHITQTVVKIVFQKNAFKNPKLSSSDVGCNCSTCGEHSVSEKLLALEFQHILSCEENNIDVTLTQDKGLLTATTHTKLSRQLDRKIRPVSYTHLTLPTTPYV